MYREQFQHGISPDQKKVNDLNEATEPRNPSELRAFLSVAQYSARFIPNSATISEPLRTLTRQDCPWNWSKDQANAFSRLKKPTSATNAYYEPHKATEIIVDASPLALAAILSQDCKSIAYASRALSDVEKRYSQTEREALAVMWGCEHFNIYTEGAACTIITDHKPLLGIWQKPDTL